MVPLWKDLNLFSSLWISTSAQLWFSLQRFQNQRVEFSSFLTPSGWNQINYQLSWPYLLDILSFRFC